MFQQYLMRITLQLKLQILEMKRRNHVTILVIRIYFILIRLLATSFLEKRM